MDSGISKKADIREEGLMMCPHFREWQTARCVAGDHGVILMPFMRKTYCVTANYHNCPFYEFTDGMTDKTIEMFLNTTREFDQGGLDAKESITK
jgi:hypothetical protein